MEFLKEILQAIKEATGISPVAFSIADTANLPAISYTIFRDGNTGAVSSFRLQTRITAQDLATAFDIEEKLSDLLVSLGDEYKFGASIQINGGGTLEDPETGYPQIITYFDITIRS